MNIIQYVSLGKRGPQVSTISFGDWAIGGVNWGPTDDEVSKKALHEALELGVTLIDKVMLLNLKSRTTFLNQNLSQQ